MQEPCKWSIAQGVWQANAGCSIHQTRSRTELRSHPITPPSPAMCGVHHAPLRAAAAPVQQQRVGARRPRPGTGTGGCSSPSAGCSSGAGLRCYSPAGNGLWVVPGGHLGCEQLGPGQVPRHGCVCTRHPRQLLRLLPLAAAAATRDHAVVQCRELCTAPQHRVTSHNAQKYSSRRER